MGGETVFGVCNVYSRILIKCFIDITYPCPTMGLGRDLCPDWTEMHVVLITPIVCCARMFSSRKRAKSWLTR